MSEYTIRFPSEASAEKALTDAGFSLGTLQRDDPRGVMFGDIAIMKWRHLSATDKASLHGIYQRAHRGGPVRIVMRTGGAPGEALRKLEAASEAAMQQAETGGEV